MLKVRPLDALIPSREVSTRVACPPYDVLTRGQAREMGADPVSFVKVVRPDAFADEAGGSSPHEFARQSLESLIDEGILEKHGPGVFSYTIEMAGRSVTGVAAAFSVEDYIRGDIKRHEHTRPGKVADRVAHIETVRCQTGLVYLLHPPGTGVEDVLEDVGEWPLLAEAGDWFGARHEVRKVPDAKGVLELLASAESLYIADGHHRAEAAAEVFRRAGSDPSAANAYFIAVSFAWDRVEILGYHRFVDQSAVPEGLHEALGRSFMVEALDGPPSAPGPGGEIVMVTPGGSFALKPKAEAQGSPAERLAASVLQSKVLGSIMGIVDPRQDPRITFVGGPGADREVAGMCKEKGGVGFLLPPAPVEAVVHVADAGEVMPPKSTWFHPKLLSGLLVRPLE